ncbi:MAG: amino acid permease [Myxococcales bacterium]|nr:amino acid permease [Myxococcales bacterium]
MAASSTTVPGVARLERKLTGVDVYAISTGAMFSSGFFLLPGLAAAQTGPSVSLAYLTASLLILPAMFSVAELATAMPRAGGAYYFLDRSMGAMVGTIGGLGSWIALVLKSAFALLGMGAYLALFVDLPIKPLAVALTAMFAVVNLVGAKETSGLQRFLVAALVGIMAWYCVEGVGWLLEDPSVRLRLSDGEPVFAQGLDGFFGTVGFVFVSYAGLTKVASVAEEVQNPDRNIPRGMIFSLLTAAVVYGLGVFLMQRALPAEAFVAALTPVADAGAIFLHGPSPTAALGLVVAAAVAAFASTGNAGLMSASRYPLAMARDRLLPARFGVLGRFGTPTLGIVITAGLMMLFIVAFDIAAVAKLASAFQLMLFGLLCAAVIVMREARIDYYRPGYRSPFYPWMQIAGLIVPVWLIVEMGWLAVLFTGGLTALCVAWYWVYAHGKVPREGAIYHVFERLGRRAWRGLDRELRGIVAERGLAEEDPFDEVVARAQVLDVRTPTDFADVLRQGVGLLAKRFGLNAETLVTRLEEERRLGLMPAARGVALPHLRVASLDGPQMVLVRLAHGVEVARDRGLSHLPDPGPIRAVLLLASPEGDPGVHLRMLAQLASRVDDPGFLADWCGVPEPGELRELLLRDERFVHLRLEMGRPTEALIGRRVFDAGLPPGALIALVRKTDRVIVPRAGEVLEAGDRLTVLAEPELLAQVRARFTENS